MGSRWNDLVVGALSSVLAIVLSGCGSSDDPADGADVEAADDLPTVTIGDVAYPFEPTSCIFVGGDLFADGPGTAADGTVYYVSIESSVVEVSIGTDSATSPGDGPVWSGTVEDFDHELSTALAEFEATEATSGAVEHASLRVTC